MLPFCECGLCSLRFHTGCIILMTRTKKFMDQASKASLRFKKGLTKCWSDVCFQDRSSEIQYVVWDTLLSDPLKSYCWSAAPCGQSVEWAFFGVLPFCSPLQRIRFPLGSSSKQEGENESDSWRSLGLPVEEARLVNHKTLILIPVGHTGLGFQGLPHVRTFCSETIHPVGPR